MDSCTPYSCVARLFETADHHAVVLFRLSFSPNGRGREVSMFCDTDVPRISDGYRLSHASFPSPGVCFCCDGSQRVVFCNVAVAVAK